MKYWLLFSVLALPACASDPAPTTPAVDGGGGGSAADSGDAAVAPSYPASPYGTDVGETLPDLSFEGWARGAGYDGASAKTSHFADFYDPSGSGGRKLLVINLCSVWCVFCKTAFDAFKEKAPEYAAKGVIVMSVLFEDGEVKPISLTSAAAFGTERGVTIPLLIDPTYQLSKVARPSEVPAYLVVSARDMKVLGVMKTIEQAPPWAFVDQKLAEMH